jgi:hypothetical protein
MRTILITIQVPASDRAAATTALEPGTAALELEIAYPMADSNDIEADHQSIALRDKTLHDVGIDFQHLSYGVQSGPTLSTFTVRRRNDPQGVELTVLARDWEQFLQVYGAAYGTFDEEELEVTIVGLAANDPQR